jgi:hypothetical protein
VVTDRVNDRLQHLAAGADRQAGNGGGHPVAGGGESRLGVGRKPA